MRSAVAGADWRGLHVELSNSESEGLYNGPCFVFQVSDRTDEARLTEVVVPPDLVLTFGERVGFVFCPWCGRRVKS
jgi:hypothetical protein